MTGSYHVRIDAFLEAEYRQAAYALKAGKADHAWHHLERAHIVAQGFLGPHLYSHWRMLRLAIQTDDWAEAAGQLTRLALAPLGNLTGRLPIGNTGRSDVSAFAHMDIPADLQAILKSQSESA